MGLLCFELDEVFPLLYLESEGVLAWLRRSCAAIESVPYAWDDFGALFSYVELDRELELEEV